MERVILLADADPVIHGLLKQIEEMHQHRDQQINFLKKQAKDIAQKADKEINPIWEQVEKLLGEKGLLKDYKEDTQHISFSIPSNSITITDCNHNEHPLKKLLGHLLPLD